MVAVKIGVLALQGAFREHADAVERCGAVSVSVTLPEHLAALDGLIIPGGESTTIGTLMADYGLLEAVRLSALSGLPIFGTCAGLILLAKQTVEASANLLGLIDILVRRNAYGRQIESFEAELRIPAAGERPFPGIFIRAPQIEAVGENVRVLAEYDGRPVLIEQGSFLAASFHPELTVDPRIHQYFISRLAAEPAPQKAGAGID